MSHYYCNFGLNVESRKWHSRGLAQGADWLSEIKTFEVPVNWHYVELHTKNEQIYFEHPRIWSRNWSASPNFLDCSSKFWTIIFFTWQVKLGNCYWLNAIGKMACIKAEFFTVASTLVTKHVNLHHNTIQYRTVPQWTLTLNWSIMSSVIPCSSQFS